jgi:hypothetical protein
MLKTKRRLEQTEAHVASTLGRKLEVINIVCVDPDGTREDAFRLELAKPITRATVCPCRY